MECPIERNARQHPDEAALVASAAIVTWRAYAERMRSCAAGCVQAGLTDGARAGLLGCTPEQMAVLLPALFHTRAVALPLNPYFSPVLLQEIFEEAGCTALITPSAISLNEKVRQVSPKALLENRTPLEGPAAWLPERAAAIVLTSGSSGSPKCALLSLGNFMASAAQSSTNLPLRPNHRWLLSLPLFHVSGLSVLFRCWTAGAAIVLPEKGQPLHEAVLAGGATHISMTPTQLHRALADTVATSVLRGLDAILLGGAPACEALVRPGARGRTANLPHLRPDGDGLTGSHGLAGRRHRGAP